VQCTAEKYKKEGKKEENFKRRRKTEKKSFSTTVNTNCTHRTTKAFELHYANK